MQVKKQQWELDMEKRTGSKLGKEYIKAVILSPCLFNLYVEYTMGNASLDEAQAGIKIAGKNINNLRYADNTTCMAESEEELKSLLRKVKEESEKVGLKLPPLPPQSQLSRGHLRCCLQGWVLTFPWNKT